MSRLCCFSEDLLLFGIYHSYFHQIDFWFFFVNNVFRPSYIIMHYAFINHYMDHKLSARARKGTHVVCIDSNISINKPITRNHLQLRSAIHATKSPKCLTLWSWWQCDSFFFFISHTHTHTQCVLGQSSNIANEFEGNVTAYAFYWPQ